MPPPPGSWAPKGCVVSQRYQFTVPCPKSWHGALLIHGVITPVPFPDGMVFAGFGRGGWKLDGRGSGINPDTMLTSHTPTADTRVF